MAADTALRIGMVAYGDISHDSRVQREARSLADAGHAVTVFALAGARDGMPLLDPRIDVVLRAPPAGTVVPGSPSPFRQVRARGRWKGLIDRVRWLSGYTRSLRAWGRAVTAGAVVDVWHAHDFAGLVAVGGSVTPEQRLVYDVHDLFVETGTAARLARPLRWAIRAYERRLVRRVDLVVAVNRPLADLIETRYRPRSMVVVHNCPPRWTVPEPRPDLIRAATAIPPEAPVVLYHGLLGRSRGLDELMAAILEPALAHAHLVLLGYGELARPLAELSRDARYGGRVHVLDAVPPAELLPWVASADVGSMAMPRASLNLLISTPNKLFECLAAGTPVVISDFPAVRSIVMDDPDGPLGATCDPADSGSVAQAIAGLLAREGVAQGDLRRRCLLAAHERWNWETEVERLVAGYADLSRRLGRAAPPA